MYEVGDIVKIKEDANTINHPYINYTGKMIKFLGHEAAVLKVETRHSRRGEYSTYKLEGIHDDAGTANGDGYWIFVEEWLEPVGPEISIEENDFENIFN